MRNPGSAFSSERGDFNWVTAVLLLILIAIIASAWGFGMPAYKNFTLGHYAYGQAVKARELSDMEITANIRDEAERLGIELSTLNLLVHRYSDVMKIEYDYKVPIKLPGLSDKSISFQKTIEKEFSDVMTLNHKKKK